MKKSITDLSLTGKKIFCRVDFNVPMQDGKITDDTRIRAALPTIQYLLDHGAKVILASHLGRPKGKVVEDLRLAPVAQRLSEHVGRSIHTIDEVVGSAVEEAASQLGEGEILLLENVRFEPGEEKNDQKLARSFASLADIFVNDAFGTAHRAHASTEGVGHYLPSVAGFLMQKELDVFEAALTSPKRPFTAIIGGAKVKDKIGIIQNLLSKVDRLLIGGGLSFTFIHAKGYGIGTSLLEEDKVEVARNVMKEAEEKGVELVLPVDAVVAKELKKGIESEVVDIQSIPAHLAAFDIGPKTCELFSKAIHSSRLVIWNGPMGVCEIDPWGEGTTAVARALVNSEAISIVGGGDSVAAIEKTGLRQRIGHISTGGGATLELLEGKVLPGIDILEDKS